MFARGMLALALLWTGLDLGDMILDWWWLEVTLALVAFVTWGGLFGTPEQNARCAQTDIDLDEEAELQEVIRDA